MDPALWEMLKSDENDEVEAIIRLRDRDTVPEGVRIIAQFGEIATCRLRRNAILETHTEETIVSLKAPRLLIPDQGFPYRCSGAQAKDSWTQKQVQEALSRHPPSLSETGQGIVIGCVDWGCDFVHPNFRHPDGRTRLLALWDQSAPTPPTPGRQNHYGYGMIHSAEHINQAFESKDPYRTLGYHPASGDPEGWGAHGTHVLDIAAGNGQAEIDREQASNTHRAPIGIAPEADLVFVHLATRGTEGLANLGDSVTLLEAVDFILRTAGERPCVINASVGRTGAAHDGMTLVEQGLDAAVTAVPGRAIVQSTGNYYNQRIHASQRLQPGESWRFAWEVSAADVTPNELEVWYPGHDTLEVEVHSPNNTIVQCVKLGDHAVLTLEGKDVGKLYHRALEPNTHDHHIDMFLYPGAPAGTWLITLRGEDIVDGRVHVWVERDAACQECQSRLSAEDVDPQFTTGTICNGLHTIAVGAYDPYDPKRILAPFSSSGPTRDGRMKPNLVAPGVEILAARSTSRDLGDETPMYTTKSGTSMAAPHVTGTIALMFEAAEQPLWIHETRKLLLSNAENITIAPEETYRVGNGYLDIEQAVTAARGSITEGNGEMNSSDRVSSPEQIRGNTFNEERNRRMLTYNHYESNMPQSEGDEIALIGHDRGEVWAESGDACFQANTEIFADDIEQRARFSNIPTFGTRIIDTAEEILIEAGSLSHGALLEAILTRSRIAHPGLFGDDNHSFTSPALVFDTFTRGWPPALLRRFERCFEVVAYPGERMGEDAFSPGDLLVERALGEGTLASISILVTGHPIPEHALVAEGLKALHRGPGYFVHILEGGAFPKSTEHRQARRLANTYGRLGQHQMVVRLREQFGIRTPYAIRSTQDHSVIPNSLPFSRKGDVIYGAEANAQDARWADNDVSPDYRHLGQSGVSQAFTFSAAHLAELIGLNHFNVNGGQDEVLFGLRGCRLVEGNSSGFADAVQLSEDVPNHYDYHCVLGVWKRSTNQIAAFTGSTVPNWWYMNQQKEKGGHIANLLLTGHYTYTVGKHKKTPGAFLQQRHVVVLRSNCNLVYEISDTFERHSPADNIHPGYSPRNAQFSSAGCQTVSGGWNKNTGHTGPWAQFRRAAGLISNTSKSGEKFVYVLLTGREARLVATSGNSASLTRLRFGSSGLAVEALQMALQRKGVYTGDCKGAMDQKTTWAWICWQKKNEGVADGIVTPAAASKLGIDLINQRSVPIADAGTLPERAFM